MPPLQLTVALDRPEALVGASLPAKVTLRNTGEGPIQAPSPDEQSQFEFLFAPVGQEGEEDLRVLSAVKAIAARNPEEPLPRLPVEMAALAPGKEFVYPHDLARFAVEPLPAGRYQLSVLYRMGKAEVVSAAVPLTIVAPRVRALAAAPGASRRNLSLVFAHADEKGTVAIYQRESGPKAPADGTAYRHAEVPPPGAVRGVATALDFGEQWEGRWFAWLQDDALGAGVAQGHSLFKLLAPVALGLKGPALQDTGWQPTVQAATFVALGANAKGRPTLAAATLEAKGSATVKTDLLAAPAIPTLWAVGRHMKADPPRYTIVWAAPWKKATRVQRQYLRFVETDTEPDALTLLETEDSVQAIALARVADAGVDTVDVLVGPAGKEPELTLFRLPLDGGDPKAKWTFPVPSTPEKALPTAYALAPVPLPDPPVLAKVGAKVVLRTAGGTEWLTLAEGAAKADHLRLEVLRSGAVWAIWADPERGFQYKPAR